VGDPSELVDIVDAADNVIATVTRREMRERNLRHRGVAVLVMHPDGRLLVHRRADTKDVWPGRWDLAAGGVVAAGESYHDAAHRELAEELGVAAGLELIGTMAFADADVSVLAHTYVARHAGPVHFTDGEVSEARWVTWADLAALLSTQPWCPDSVTLALPVLLGPLRFAGGSASA
jgi:isopentenyldiphosphate isomerase